MSKKDKDLTELEKLIRVIRLYLEYFPFVALFIFIGFLVVSCNAYNDFQNGVVFGSY